jgi:hypothetical protein
VCEEGQVISSLYGRLLDKLPTGGKVIFWSIATPLLIWFSIDMIRRDGLGIFVLKVIFSP